jgi:hypothetical protein
VRSVAFVLCIVGCGFPQPKDIGGDDVGSDDGGIKDAAVDAPDGPPAQCDVFAQTGCPATQKCTWILDSDTTSHIACVANGTVADKGACTFSNATIGYDNCVKGSFCFNNVCATICNPMNATNTCGASAACTAYSAPEGAGACIPVCNPLDDNTFRSGATKPGTACTAAQGCYGSPSSTSGNPTKFQCASDLHITNRVVHRAQCTSSNMCASSQSFPYLNGCSQGYIPLMRENTTSTTIVCVAMCKPANCYSGNCTVAGVTAAPGVAPHACNTTNAEGTFDPASSTNNGDHCMYSWIFELDASMLVRSATSDTVGFCVNHKMYQYDSNQDGTPDTNWPLCASLPLTNSTGPSAPEFGCVDTATAGVQFTGKKKPLIDLRLPYGALPLTP